MSCLSFIFFLNIDIRGNTAPVLSVISDQNVLEGESLSLSVTATDADGDDINIGIISCPPGGVFDNTGNGTASLLWTPDYTGPNSSENSPFMLTFWAGDGTASTSRQIRINVINNNRRPTLFFPASLVSVAGDKIEFDISYEEPDRDPVEWSLLSLPAQSTFVPGTPARFDWQTLLRDSGQYQVSIVVSDQFGATDTADISLNVAPALVYALSIDTMRGYPGEAVTANINLLNLETISGFDLLVSYDVSAMTISNITKVGTRAGNFEYFNYTLNYRGMLGDIRIIGTADIFGGLETPDLAPGNGSLAKLTFFLTNDLNYGGFALPINFGFRDLIDKLDNVLFDTAGVRIEQTAINYQNGYIIIQKPDISNLGDINLNGIPYEIGDAVVFTNYFINPRQFPLNSTQRAYSDVNQDGMPATVADLVYLINKLVSIPGSGKLRYDGAGIEIASQWQEGDLTLSYRFPDEVGAVLVTLASDPQASERLSLKSSFAELGIDCKWASDGPVTRVLIYSENGKRLPAGTNEFLRISGDASLEIREIEISSTDGFMVPVTIKQNLDLLPVGFALHQNHPNPFNPSTQIAFDIPKTAFVDLTVYNILGREVRKLVYGELPAGRHQITWDGHDNNGGNIASGIYFYKITAGDFNDRKKMILLK